MITHRSSLSTLIPLIALICKVGCSCKWDIFNGQPGLSSNPDITPRCREDQVDESVFNYQAECDTYIDLDMKQCYKENWLGILVGGYYIYGVDIKVKNARSTNLFTQNFSSYNGLRIKSLDISGQLTEIPAEIHNLKYLEHIYLSHNQITNVETTIFATLPKLGTLDLTYNGIRDINFECLSNVQSEMSMMDLSHNKLQQFPVTCLCNYQKLRFLDLSHNEITYIYLKDFKGDLSLRRLELSHNKLTSLDGSAFQKLSHELWYLDVSHNKITNIASNNIVSFEKLLFLILSYNQIHVLDDFKKNPKLSELILDHNKITKITRNMFENNIKLHVIWLNDNPIDKIESNSFNKNENLLDVVLRNTRLSSIERNTFNGYKKSGIIDLSKCMITQIRDYSFTGVTGLSNLNLSSNAIQNISNFAFYNLVSLRKLDLSHNQLKKIEFDTNNLQNLQELYARHNEIEKISKSVFENLLALTDLDLSFNNIKEMDPMALANMKKLININLSSNKDFDVMINSPLSELEYLEQIQMVETGNTIYKNGSMTHFRGNQTTLNSAFGKVKQIEYNAFGHCLFLRYLNLSHNELESFHVNTTSIKYIKELNLANNHIQEINSDTFYDLHDLATLNLANNDIVHVDSNAFDNLPALKYFYISSTVTPRRILKLTDLQQHFEILSIENFNLDMKFNDSQYYIKTLELKSCGIEDLNTLHISNILELQDLNLNGNDISIVNHETLKDLSSLVTLSLSNNNITFVLAGSFLNMNRLRNLDLSGNKISSIFYGVLDGPEKLEHLNLSSNLIKNLGVKVLPPTSYLYLDKNPLTSVNLNDVYNSDMFKISLGYTISCEYLVNAKKNSPDNFKKFVTADPPNFYIQNVNGVPC